MPSGLYLRDHIAENMKPCFKTFKILHSCELVVLFSVIKILSDAGNVATNDEDNSYLQNLPNS